MTYNIKKEKNSGILYSEWKLPDPEAVFLLVHGLGAHSGRWDFFADFFGEKKIASYALELKGFGQTPPPKGHVDSFSVYFRDISSLYGVIRKEYPGKKVFIAGESMGALISFIYVLENPDIFDGIVCMSPVFASRLKLSFMKYLKLVAAYFLAPSRSFSLPFTSDMCTRDSIQSSVMDEDPLEHRSASARLLGDIFISQMRSRLSKNKINIPVLFLLSGQDKIVSPEASINIFGSIEAEDKKMVEYHEMYHALSIDDGKEKVFMDILDWITGRIKEQ